MPESRPHILLVENAPGFGGSTRCLLNLVEVGCAREWHVSVASSCAIAELERADLAPAPPGSVSRLFRLDRMTSHRLAGQLRRLAPSGSGVATRVANSAAFGLSAMAGDLPAAIGLAVTIRRDRVSLVHTNNDLLANRVAIVAAWLAGVPVVCHQRGEVWACGLTRWLARRASRIVAISDFVAASLRRAGVTDCGTTRLYDGVDVAGFAGAAAFRDDARSRWGFERSDVVVGLPAVLLPWKGHELFLRAFREAAAGRPQLRGLIVGGAPQGGEEALDDLRRRVATAGLKDRVLVPGHVADMRQAYAAMDIIAHTSVLPEPFGLVIVEAMAAGKPVVAADVGGPAEIIGHGRDGLLYPMGDGAALARAVSRLADEAALRARLGAVAVERARDFDMTHHAEGIASLYDAVLNQPTGGIAPGRRCQRAAPARRNRGSRRQAVGQQVS